jgi:general stress protein 26
MQSYLPLNFLQEKIISLQTALFFSLSPSVIKFPVSVIRVLHIDKAGQIWFCAHGPLQSARRTDNSFPSHLQFFRKGEQFFLRIKGRASVVNDPGEIKELFFVKNEMITDIFTGRVMLIKVQIQYADYFERKPPAEKTAWRNIPAQLFELFFKPYEPSHKPQRTFVLPIN